MRIESVWKFQLLQDVHCHRIFLELANNKDCTACGYRMAHRKRKDPKLQPGTAGPGSMIGSCLVSFHFLYRADGVDGPQEMERN